MARALLVSSLMKHFLRERVRDCVQNFGRQFLDFLRRTVDISVLWKVSRAFFLHKRFLKPRIAILEAEVWIGVILEVVKSCWFFHLKF